MKAIRTIRRQMAKVKAISQMASTDARRREAYVAWHALRWVLESGLAWTPEDILASGADERANRKEGAK